MLLELIPVFMLTGLTVLAQSNPYVGLLFDDPPCKLLKLNEW
jgi:hypothetical protein